MFGIFTHPKKVGSGRATPELSMQAKITDLAIGARVIVEMPGPANWTYSRPDLTFQQDREPHHVHQYPVL